MKFIKANKWWLISLIFSVVVSMITNRILQHFFVDGWQIVGFVSALCIGYLFGYVGVALDCINS